jgi:hypothetical protein
MRSQITELQILSTLVNTDAQEYGVPSYYLQNETTMNILQRFMNWFLRLFVYRGAQASLPAPTETPVVKKRRSPKKQRQVNSERKKTIGDLLNNLDHTFSELARADGSMSWTDPVLRKNLRDMGPLVAQEGWEIFSDRIQYTDKLPALAFVSTAAEHGDAANFFPQFFYACKVNKFGPNVRALAGVKYECGICYTTANRKQDDGKRDKLRLQWFCFEVTVDPHSGKVSVARRLRSRYHQVGSNSHAHGFTRREWCLPFGESEERITVIASAALNLTAYKNDNWTIGVRKNGQRVTFVIPDNEAKHFFNDRVKVYANGGNGRMRPIMHIVEGHQRKYRSGKVADVPTHIRGLRQFEWNGYECSISAPDFHAFQSQTFDAEAQVLDEELELVPMDRMVDNVGAVLAAMEDHQDPKLGHAIMHVTDDPRQSHAA